MDLDHRNTPAVFHVHDRVEQGFDLMSGGCAFTQQRIDQERHVRTDRLEHRPLQRSAFPVRRDQDTGVLQARRDAARPGPKVHCQLADVALGQTGQVFIAGFLIHLRQHLLKRVGLGKRWGHEKSSLDVCGNFVRSSVRREGLQWLVTNETDWPGRALVPIQAGPSNGDMSDGPYRRSAGWVGGRPRRPDLVFRSLPSGSKGYW